MPSLGLDHNLSAKLLAEAEVMAMISYVVSLPTFNNPMKFRSLQDGFPTQSPSRDMGRASRHQKKKAHALLIKIDWFILSYVCLMYWVNYLDRVSILNQVQLVLARNNLIGNIANPFQPSCA